MNFVVSFNIDWGVIAFITNSSQFHFQKWWRCLIALPVNLSPSGPMFKQRNLHVFFYCMKIVQIWQLNHISIITREPLHKIHLLFSSAELHISEQNDIAEPSTWYILGPMVIFSRTKFLWPNTYWDQLRYFRAQNVCPYYCSPLRYFFFVQLCLVIVCPTKREGKQRPKFLVRIPL